MFGKGDEERWENNRLFLGREQLPGLCTEAVSDLRGAGWGRTYGIVTVVIIFLGEKRILYIGFRNYYPGD
jgi:hypothetical protein